MTRGKGISADRFSVVKKIIHPTYEATTAGLK